MTRQTGFSDVDGSGQSAALVEYLAALATALGDMRREDYESLQLAPDAAVLDVGCGAGEVCVDLAQRVGPRGRVAGVDPSEAMIAAARQAATASGPAIELQVASIYMRCCSGNATFDVVRRRSGAVPRAPTDPEAGPRETILVAGPARGDGHRPTTASNGTASTQPRKRWMFEGEHAPATTTNFHQPGRGCDRFLRAGWLMFATLFREPSELGRLRAGAVLAQRLASAIEAGEIDRRSGAALRRRARGARPGRHLLRQRDRLQRRGGAGVSARRG